MKHLRNCIVFSKASLRSAPPAKKTYAGKFFGPRQPSLTFSFARLFSLNRTASFFVPGTAIFLAGSGVGGGSRSGGGSRGH